MTTAPVVVFTTQARADAARRLLASACQATGLAARLEVFGSNGSLFARVSGQRDGPRGDLSPCLTADGMRLYFVSDRPGGKGGLDIWYVPTAQLKAKEAK